MQAAQFSNVHSTTVVTRLPPHNVCHHKQQQRQGVRAWQTAAIVPHTAASAAAAAAAAPSEAAPQQQQQQQHAGSRRRSRQSEEQRPREASSKQQIPQQQQQQHGQLAEAQQAWQQEPPNLPQQQQQQQVPVVLTPVERRAPAQAPGSVLRSSALGSWSSVNSADTTAPVKAPPAPGVPQRTEQQQQQQERWQQHPQQEQQQERWEQELQQQQQVYEEQLMLAAKLAEHHTVESLQSLLSDHVDSRAVNMTNLAAAYKVLASLAPKYSQRQQWGKQQQRWTQREQQQQQQPAAAGGYAVLDTLQLLEQLLSQQLAVVAARKQRRQVTAGAYKAATKHLPSILSSCNSMGHRLPRGLLLSLLEAFVRAAQAELQLQLQLEQQHAADNAVQPPQEPGSSSSSSSRSLLCRALSQLCDALSKSGLTCTQLYQTRFSDSSSGGMGEQPREQHRQQQLGVQRRYWKQLAAIAVEVAAAGAPRAVAILSYGFAAGGYKDASFWTKLAAVVTQQQSSSAPEASGPQAFVPEYKLTTYLSSARSVEALWVMVLCSQDSPVFSIVHTATAYTGLARLTLGQQQQQQRQQVHQQQQQQQWQQAPEAAQQQPTGGDAHNAVGTDTVDSLAHLLEKMLSQQLAAAQTQRTQAAAGSGATSLQAQAAAGDISMRHGSGSMALQPQTRALATIVHSCSRMGRRLPRQLLLSLVDTFLHSAQAQLSQQQQQQQQQQENKQEQDAADIGQQPEAALQQVWALPGSNSSSGDDGGGDYAAGGSVGGSNSGGSSSSSSDEQQLCHALSLLCWALGKAKLTCTEVYEPSSSSSSRVLGPERQLLEVQQLYWQRLAAVAAQVAAAGTPRDLSTLCYGVAAGGYKDVSLWGRLGPVVTARLNSFTPQEFAQTLWAFATAELPYQPLFRGASTLAVQLMPGFTPQGMCNVLWALSGAATHGRVPHSVLEAAHVYCMRSSLEAFGSVNLTVLVHAFARGGQMRIELGVQINKAVLRLLPQFSSENLCKVLSGLGRLNCLTAPLTEAACSRLQHELQRGWVDVQAACHGVWGVVHVHPDAAADLLPSLLQLADRHLHVLARSSDATSKLCSTLAAVRYRDDGFVDRLANYLLTGQRPDRAPAAAAATAAAATAAVLPDTSFAGAGAAGGSGYSAGSSSSGSSPVAAAAQPAAAVATPLSYWGHLTATQHITNIARMLAKLGYSRQTLLLQGLLQQWLTCITTHNISLTRSSSSSSSSGSLHGDAASFYQQHAVMLLWCAAVLNMHGPSQLLRQLMQQLAGAQDLPTQVMAQLVQVYMWLQSLGPAGAPLTSQLPQPLLQEALNIWQQQLVPAVVRSHLHNEVLTMLASMGLQPVCEAVTADGMFSVDIMVNFQGHPVAVEVLGPEHFTSNKVPLSALFPEQQQQQQLEQDAGTGSQQQQPLQHVLLGPDLLRFRLLSARGLALAAVSSFEASGALATAAGAATLRQLLTHKLQEAVTLQQQWQQQQGQVVQEQQSPQGQQRRKRGQLKGRQQKEPPASSSKKTAVRVHSPKVGMQQQHSGDTGIAPVVLQAATDPTSNLLLQPGFTEAGKRRRRNRTQLSEQRAQQQQAQQQGRQAAMQTLLAAAAGRGVDSAAAVDAAVPALLSVDDAHEQLAADADFDLPLDLDALS